MTSREMHLDFKMKLNKIDSQKYRNLFVPEIDWKLNEAQEVFVRMIAEPRNNQNQGFEFNQRSIDDLRTIVINQSIDSSTSLTKFDDTSYIAPLPDDYWYKLGVKVFATKNNCQTIDLSNVFYVRHDENNLNTFNLPSFEWRQVNIRFLKEGIRVFTDGTFIIDRVVLNYIKKLRKIHNAQDAKNGQYKDLGTGVILTGSQDCELPEGTHRNIVDLAVLITTGELQIPDYQIKQQKLNLN